MPTLATYIQGSIRSLSHSNQTENEIKGIQTGKVVIKLSLFADDMILYIENSTDTTYTHIHTHTHTHTQTRTNQWIDQIAGYKINIQKSLTFLYTNNENHQKEKLMN